MQGLEPKVQGGLYAMGGGGVIVGVYSNSFLACVLLNTIHHAGFRLEIYGVGNETAFKISILIADSHMHKHNVTYMYVCIILCEC